MDGVQRQLIGTSRGIVRLREAIACVARSDACVLIRGETGSGKGLVARRIHAESARHDRPFVHVDCAALSPTVIESELFGHERGAFTDAVARRPGRLELARDGTLFLDEIGDLALPLQAKLLRVLQDREFERVGGVETLALRARVIAATHRDLPARIEVGRFRRDLYYRLDVLSLSVPPLRERLEDLPALLAALQSGRTGAGAPFSAAAVERLCEHDWPGNVRELANVVERCLTFEHERPIGAPAVERALAGGSAREPALAANGDRADAAQRETIKAERETIVAEREAIAAEREAIVAELQATGGNVRRAARRLGLPRSTLRYRIQRHALEHLLPRDDP